MSERRFILSVCDKYGPAISVLAMAVIVMACLRVCARRDKSPGINASVAEKGAQPAHPLGQNAGEQLRVRRALYQEAQDLLRVAQRALLYVDLDLPGDEEFKAVTTMAQWASGLEDCADLTSRRHEIAAATTNLQDFISFKRSDSQQAASNAKWQAERATVEVQAQSIARSFQGIKVNDPLAQSQVRIAALKAQNAAIDEHNKKLDAQNHKIDSEREAMQARINRLKTLQALQPDSQP